MFERMSDRWPDLKRDAQALLIVMGLVLSVFVWRGGRDRPPMPNPSEPPTRDGANRGEPAVKNTRIQVDLASKKAAPNPPPSPQEQPTPAPTPTPMSDGFNTKAEPIAKQERKEPAKPAEPLPTPTNANPVRATTVEKKIRSVETMTAKEQQDLLESYAAWEKEGRIRIRVLLVDATPNVIEAIADSFYLQRGTTKLHVKSGTWNVHPLDTDTDVLDAVLQSLPTDKWPNRLMEVCRKFLAEISGVRADVLLTPKARLEVYRRVGEVDLKDKLSEGTIVNLKLAVDPKNNQWSFTVSSIRKGESLGMKSNGGR